jgi:hypothetical protein
MNDNHTPADAALGVERPKFLAWYLNPSAGEQNPSREGMYFRTTSMKVNRFGATVKLWELTNGKGQFWKIEPKYLVPIDRPSYAALQAEVAAHKAERDRAVQGALELRGRVCSAYALAERWERMGEDHGVRTFTGNDHKLFANELRAAIEASRTMGRAK